MPAWQALGLRQMTHLAINASLACYPSPAVANCHPPATGHAAAESLSTTKRKGEHCLRNTVSSASPIPYLIYESLLLFPGPRLALPLPLLTLHQVQNRGGLLAAHDRDPAAAMEDIWGIRCQDRWHTALSTGCCTMAACSPPMTEILRQPWRASGVSGATRINGIQLSLLGAAPWRPACRP